MKHAQQIRDFVVSNFLFGDASALQDDTSFLNSGIVDSTGILELVMFLETTYGIKVDPQEMLPENFDSVSRVVAFVTRKTGEIRQPASLT
jgi:acyl carrier protein